MVNCTEVEIRSSRELDSFYETDFFVSLGPVINVLEGPSSGGVVCCCCF